MSMRKALNQEPTGTMYDEQERQKTLRQNREQREPQEPRLEWIYTGDKAQSEDFLLGKKVGANTQLAVVADEIDDNTTIDVANKIREDPLYLIKKKEIEQRKKILENPVRLKQLKELLERQESAYVPLPLSRFQSPVSLFSVRRRPHARNSIVLDLPSNDTIGVVLPHHHQPVIVAVVHHLHLVLHHRVVNLRHLARSHASRNARKKSKNGVCVRCSPTAPRALLNASTTFARSENMIDERRPPMTCSSRRRRKETIYHRPTTTTRSISFGR